MHLDTSTMTWLKQFGLGTVLAISLVYWLTTNIDGKLDGHIEEQRVNLGLIRQICLNTATTDAQRAGCDFRLDAHR